MKASPKHGFQMCEHSCCSHTDVCGLTCRVPVSLAFSGCLQVSVQDGILLVQSPSPEETYLNPVCSRKNRLASHVSGSCARLQPDFTTHASCCGLLTHSSPQLCYQIWKKCTEGQCIEKAAWSMQSGLWIRLTFLWLVDWEMPRSLFLYPKYVF